LSYLLTVNGKAPSGLMSLNGTLLDGDQNGQPGNNYVTSITRSNLSGAASERPMAVVVNGRGETAALRAMARAIQSRARGR
jgi:hypothetical protein